MVAVIVLILLGGGYFVWKSIADINEANSFAWPVKIAEGEKLNISAVYGNRIHPIFNIKNFHQGIDIDLNKDREIVACMGGKVEFSERHSGYGNCIILSHKNGFTSLYGHLDRMIFRVGQMVKKGDVVGYAGSTGNTATVQLHFETMNDGEFIDPIQFINSKEK
jgi:murein DD-endopeptidase MepM/ murein hydrolase activator NlpD